MLRSLFMVATVTLGALLGQTHVAQAQRAGITADIATRQIVMNGQTITMARIQDTAHWLDNGFTKTSRPCPPFCIAPISAAPGDRTLGELEVMDSLATDVADGRGLLIVFQSDRAETGAPGGAQVSRANTSLTAAALARIVPQATAADGRSANTRAPVADSNGIALPIGARGDRETPQYDIYTVDGGDSLGAIAIRFHGDVRHYTAIFDANRVQLASPDRIRAGQRLWIPKV